MQRLHIYLTLDEKAKLEEILSRRAVSPTLNPAELFKYIDELLEGAYDYGVYDGEAHADAI